MNPFHLVLFIFVLLQRLVELVIAKRNEKLMKRRGAIEIGQAHYKWFILVHSLFFICLFGEWLYYQPLAHVNGWLFIIFIVLQIGRLWCLISLGRYWNTKIIYLPGARMIKKGPYKYMKHPNYLIVGLELFILPLLFQAYMCAIIFPLLHVLLLRVRIPIENKALLELK